jgi:hypothetical protein
VMHSDGVPAPSIATTSNRQGRPSRPFRAT